MDSAEWIKQCSNFLNNIEVRTIGTEFSPDPLGWMMRKCIDMRVRNLRQPVPGEATEDNEDNENNDCNDNLFANETLVVTYYRNSQLRTWLDRAPTLVRLYVEEAFHRIIEANGGSLEPGEATVGYEGPSVFADFFADEDNQAARST